MQIIDRLSVEAISLGISQGVYALADFAAGSPEAHLVGWCDKYPCALLGAV
jgi:hypothetical protein